MGNEEEALKAENSNDFKEFVEEQRKTKTIYEAADLSAEKLGEFIEVADWDLNKNGKAGKSHPAVFNYCSGKSNELKELIALNELKRSDALNKLQKGEISGAEYNKVIQETQEPKITAEGAACMEIHSSVLKGTLDAHPGWNGAVTESGVIYDGQHAPFVLNDGTKNYVVVNWDSPWKYENMPSVIDVTRDWLRKDPSNIPFGADKFLTADGKNTAYYGENVPGLEPDQHGKKSRLRSLDVAMDSKTPSETLISQSLEHQFTSKKLLNSTHKLGVEYSYDKGEDPYYGDYKAHNISGSYQGDVPIGDEGREATLYGQIEVGNSKTNAFVIHNKFDDGQIKFLEKKNNFIATDYNAGAQYKGKKYEVAGIESQGLVNVEHAQYYISDKADIIWNKQSGMGRNRRITAGNHYNTFAVGGRTRTVDENSKVQFDGAANVGVRTVLGESCFGGKLYEKFHPQLEGTASVKGNASICTQNKESIEKGKTGFGLQGEGYASSNFSPYYKNNENKAVVSGTIENDKLKVEVGGGREKSRIVINDFPGAYVEKDYLARLSFGNDRCKVITQVKNPLAPYDKKFDLSKSTIGVNTIINF